MHFIGSRLYTSAVWAVEIFAQMVLDTTLHQYAVMLKIIAYAHKKVLKCFGSHSVILPLKIILKFQNVVSLD